MKKYRVSELHDADPHDLAGVCCYLADDVERLRSALEWILSERVLRAFDGALYKIGSLEELAVPTEFADLIPEKEMT